MTTESKPAANLSRLLDVAREGSPAERYDAREQLATAIYGRTVRLVAAMLRDFPVVQLRFYTGASTKDTAEALGLPVGRVRKLWVTAWEKLNGYLPDLD